jgi:hypothetical protein
MIESKKGGLTISVAQTKLVGDVAVGLCFPLQANGCVLARLNGCAGCNSECFPAGSEEAALGYSLYLSVQQILCGDPLAVSKTKVGDVTCVQHNGMFGINWKVKGTGSAVRKSIGLALKALDPNRQASTWSRCIKHIGGSADRDVFNYVADDVASSIKAHLQCVVVGNINIDKEKLEGMMEVLSKKHSVSAVKGTKTKPSGHTQCDHKNLTEVAINGWESAVASDYIQSKAKGLVPMLCNKSLLIPISGSQWETLSKKIKKGVKEYAATKYAKVGDALPAVFGYLALAGASLCAGDVKTAIANKLSVASIEAAINKVL